MSYTVRRGIDQFMSTMGNLPEPIRALIQYAPEAFPGYMTMRECVYQEPPKGHLDLRTKELVFVILDVVSGNLEGAKNHVAAALRAGLTVGELTEALIQVMMVCGITTWGQTGYKVLDHAAALAKEMQGGTAE